MNLNLKESNSSSSNFSAAGGGGQQTSSFNQFTRPIVYGSQSSLIGENDPPPETDGHSHRWTVYVKGLYDEDIAYFIEKVSFKLHESFKKPDRIIKSPPYQVTETGWGEFDIIITIWFTDPNCKPISFTHLLQLHHKDGNPHNLPFVRSERYEELEFHSPSPDLADALQAHPWDGLPKTIDPKSPFGRAAVEAEHKFLQDKLQKLLAEYEIIKQAGPGLEADLTEAVTAMRRAAADANNAAAAAAAAIASAGGKGGGKGSVGSPAIGGGKGKGFGFGKGGGKGVTGKGGAGRGKIIH